MNKEEILELLAQVTEKESTELAAIPEDKPLREFGFESLEFIRFIVAFEDKYGLEIRDSDLILARFDTLASLYSTLGKYFKSAQVPKKVLVCDCDNVLWRGVAGEEPIKLDYAARSLQLELLRLARGGALLCLCSRNEPGNIDEAFDTLPMLIEKDKFICYRIDRRDKAGNIREMAQELNLSLDSFVFLDDSPYELGLVNALLPEVETVRADPNHLSYIEDIGNRFWSASAQSLDRTQLYREQKEREKQKPLFPSVKEYNESLETTMSCAAASPEQATRLAELSQRTNQCNLSGNRYTGDEIKALISRKDFLVLSLSVADKYGDMGIVGAAVVRLEGSRAVIESFFLSCRAFDRGFETMLLDEIRARCAGQSLCGVFVLTAKNSRYHAFYPDNGVPLYE
ncbi:MAG: HAD-IIIC family phosphatase [Clostridiales bacterium]|nr:HAD-IIIC family phosphatase [Clostridiales bacterium]